MSSPVNCVKDQKCENRRPGRLIIYSGPSGVGKGTILKQLLETDPWLWLSVSVTTRQPRPGEVDGVHYHFISQEVYDRLVAEDGMLEHAVYSSASYGTPRRPVEERLAAGYNVVLEIDVQGAFQVKEKCPDALMIFILPPSVEVLRHRLVERNTETPQAVERRMAAAVKELELAGRYDYQVVNDRLEDAVDQVRQILCRETCCKA